jgi:drug/metabolite transporter (DMT)-like permease
MFITPFLTSIFGFFIASEVPDQATMIGGSIILLGVLLFNFGEKIYSLFSSFFAGLQHRNLQLTACDAL